MGGKTLRFDDGAVQFRQRLVVSLLSHRPLLIRNIRSDDLDSPGLREHEACFLRLLDKMTNGTAIEINATGTQLRFKPGTLLGGELTEEHVCFVPEENIKDDTDTDTDTTTTTTVMAARGIGWYLEGIIPLAPFGKEPLQITLTGITDGACEVDPSPDYLASTMMPLLIKFGVGAEADETPPPSITVTRRGAAPLGGGRVDFFCPIVKELLPIDYCDQGKVKRIRGACTSCKISPSSSNRVAYAARGLLNRLLPDVWIRSDVHSSTTKHGKRGCGPSPGLSLCLTAETTTGVRLAAECCLDPKQPRGAELPEDLGQRGAALLLEEVRRGGCVDTSAQSTALLWMCLGPEDVSRLRLGTLSEYTIVSLRLFKEALDVEFKVTPDPETKTVLMSCLGTGYRNLARAST